MADFKGSPLFKILKFTGLGIISFLLLLLITPFFFKDSISIKIKQWADKNLRGELSYSDVSLSFFNHFPALTLTLYDFNLKGSAPYKKQTLVGAEEIALGIDLKSVFAQRLDIDELYLSDAKINILINEKGEPNYNVYISENDKKKKDDSSSMSLKIEQILIENSHLVYDDKSLPMLLDAKGFNYKGKGDLSKDVFDLASSAHSDSLDLYYDGLPYLLHKQINANLITQINTRSLRLLFQRTDLKVNMLPVQFTGRFDFLKEGYDMDFKISSQDANLHDFFTAFPPQYQKWLEKTQVDGRTDFAATLKGQYISEKRMPDFNLNMKIRNGLIANQKVPSPVKNLFLNMDVKLPGLEPDSTYLRIDSLFFNIDKDYFSSIITLKGLKNPYIFADIDTKLDLEKWQKAYGIADYSVKGQYNLHLKADGRYVTGPNPNSLRKDTIILSVPKFKLASSLTNGYFKYASLPQSVNNISFNISGSCPDNQPKNATIAIENLNADVLKNHLKGFLKINGAKGFPLDANLKASFNLADLKKVYPIDSVDLKGVLNMDMVTKGKYDPDSKLFPQTKALFTLSDGYLKTNLYPHPIEKISINAEVISNKGTYQDLKVSIKPLTFLFENSPFSLNADLANFDNVDYLVNAKGQIDLGRIYKVFSQKGIDVNGRIDADFSLRGRQSDAQAKRYNRLHNSGTLKLYNINLTSENFPKPFVIETGVFRFKDDKIWFDQFKSKYGQTDIMLDGHMSNVFNYVFNDELLMGTFQLKSNYLLIDEFLAFSGTEADSTQNDPGVVIVPQNLDLQFKALAKKVKYNELDIDSCKGQMTIKNGQIVLKETGFNLIGCKVLMDASYASVTPYKAVFDYHLDARDFDVQRAYKEVKIFHDLAPSAAKAHGIVSVNYQLKGRLNSGMMPVYPSLVGKGVLSIKDVKIAGLKMFTAVSKSTGREDINNPNLKKVEIKTSIKNNVIHLEPTKFKIAGFRPKIQGQTTFDGRLNLKCRLGLPPFGIIGIPMTITGTRDNPKVKLGRETADEKEMETEDKDEAVQDTIKKH